MSHMKQKSTRFLLNTGLLCVALVLLASCVGVDAKIKLADSGSGDLIAEYRVSNELLSFGELDENKAQLPLPLSRSDVESSLGGKSGLVLKSWSSSKSGKDTVIKMDIGFSSIDALIAYLDPEGKLAHYDRANGVTSLYFSLGRDFAPLDSDGKQLAIEAFDTYTFRLTVEAPKAIKMANSSNAIVSAKIDGKTASFSGAMKDIVTSEKAPAFSVSW